VSWFTKPRWTRAFEFLEYQELGNMKAPLPTDDKPETTFMAMFFLRLPAEMMDHHW
jgi:hypothetical protein